ncbi:MAG: hypothetical protein IPM06_19605 [Rhizobiales bacterium]|nr:hypothetical protein [Hyphomicrobiales bacterium]
MYRQLQRSNSHTPQHQETTNRIRARWPGDATLSLPFVNVGSLGKMSAPEARLAAGAYDRPPKQITMKPEPPPVEPPPSFQVPALAHILDSSSRQELAIGYDSTTGDIAKWIPTEQSHLRIHGATQKGKTQFAIGLVAAMLSQQWQVFIADRRNFKDWSIADSRAELVDARRPEAFLDALKAVHAEYERREKLLGEHGARDIDQLRSGIRPPRLGVILEEYGAQRVAANTSGCMAEIDAILAILASEAAADGIHLVAIDQRPVSYHPTVKANTAPVVFNLPEGSGGASGYWKAHKLPRFTFFWDGGIFRSVPASVDFESVMVRRSPPRYPALMGKRSNVPEAMADVYLPEVERPGTAANVVQNVPTGTDESTRWDAVVDAWFAVHPEALFGPAKGISDLARAMCADNEGGSTDNYEAYKGRAHPLFHAFRENIRLPSGDRLGTDIAAEVTA